MSLDAFPELNQEELTQQIRRMLKDEPDKFIKIVYMV